MLTEIPWYLCVAPQLEKSRVKIGKSGQYYVDQGSIQDAVKKSDVYSPKPDVEFEKDPDGTDKYYTGGPLVKVSGFKMIKNAGLLP